MQLVSVNKTFVMRSILLALLLLWPLLMMGKPAYMVDSAAYQNGGEQAVVFVAKKLHLQALLPEKGAPDQGTAKPKDEDNEETKVARSILYSVLGYLLSGPGLTMGYLAVFHALCVGLSVTALHEAVAGAAWRSFLVMAGVVTFATGLAPTVNFIIPDCFAAIMLGIMMILPFYWDRFTWPMRLFLLAMGIFSVALHASHPPVAIGTAIVATLWILLLRRQRPSHPVAALIALWSPAILGLGLVMLTGLVGFGKASVAPKHHPLALARGVDNGPARWYLEEECRDRTRYAICEVYGTEIPETVQQMLWSKNNLIRRATPEQLDRIRAEEQTILLRASLRYPLQQAYHVFHDVPQQFFTFRLDHFIYGSSIDRNDAGLVILKNPGTGKTPVLLQWLDIVADIVLVISTGLLAWWWRGMTVAQRGLLVTLVAGLLANAAVCAIFSGVAPRYQARLIWLVPFAAIAIGFAQTASIFTRNGK